MKCPQCQTENIDDAVYCFQCGRQLKSEPVPLLWTGVRKKICTNCFFPSYRTSTFCIRCGTKLPDQDSIRQTYLSQEKIFAMLLEQNGIIPANARIEIETINKTKPDHNFMDTLIKSQFAPEAEVLTFLSQKLNVPFAPISQFPQADKSLLKLLPEGVARRQNVCVVGSEGGLPLIAMSNPLSTTAFSELRSILPDESLTVICTENDIKKKFDAYYPKHVTAPKISSATQIEAYDIDTVNVKPTKKSTASEIAGEKMYSTAVIKSSKKRSNPVLKTFFLILLFGAIGAGGYVAYKSFKDTINLPAHLKAGNEHFAVKNYIAAIKEFQFYLTHRSDDIDIHFKLAKALYANGNYGEALDHFNIVTARMPGSADAHYLAGLCNFNYKTYGQAIVEFEKTLQLDPKKIDANKYIGIANIHLGAHEDAIPYLEKTLKHSPDNNTLAEWLIKAYMNSKKYTKSIALSKKMLNKNQSNPEVLFAIGYAKSAMGDFAQGIKHYQQSGLYIADSPEKHLKKAYTLMQEKQYDESISEYIKVLSVKENDSEAYNNLGLIYRKKGYTKSSEECFKKAKRILKIRY